MVSIICQNKFRTQSDAQTIKQSLTNSSVIQLRIHAKIANH